MPIYTFHGCTIAVAKGGQSATASRPEVRDATGAVIQSAAAAEFMVLPAVDAPTPQVQAQRWAKSLTRIADASPEPIAVNERLADEADEVEGDEVEGDE